MVIYDKLRQESFIRLLLLMFVFFGSDEFDHGVNVSRAGAACVMWINDIRER